MKVFFSKFWCKRIQVNKLFIESMAYYFRIHEAHLQLSMTEILAYFLHHSGTLWTVSHTAAYSCDKFAAIVVDAFIWIERNREQNEYEHCTVHPVVVLVDVVVVVVHSLVWLHNLLTSFTFQLMKTLDSRALPSREVFKISDHKSLKILSSKS